MKIIFSRQKYLLLNILMFLFSCSISKPGEQDQKSLQSSASSSDPVIMLTSPTSTNITTAYDVLVFKGTASVGASYSITAVQFRTNGGDWETATGTTSWSFTNEFPYYTNMLEIIAIASSGKTNSINVKVVRDIAIFVRKTGNDTNTGLSANKSVETIQEGIQQALTYNIPIVKVAQGVYNTFSGLGSGESGVYITNFSVLLLEGGYDLDFTTVNTMTVLDGDNTKNHLIFVSNARNVVIGNFLIRNGNANGSALHACGGGVLFYATTNTILTNVLITNNKASFNGGGVYVANSHTNYLYVDVYANETANIGGGIGFSNTVFGWVQGTVRNNMSRTNGGGGIGVTSFSTNIFINQSKIYSNIAVYGGGVYAKRSTVQTVVITGDIYQNFATNQGGGIYLSGVSPNTIIQANLYSNAVGSDGHGGGLALISLTTNWLQGNIYHNVANYGGGVYAYQISGSTFTMLNIYSNFATNLTLSSGGGIYLDRCVSNSLECFIQGNVARLWGGGISFSQSHWNSNVLTVWGNTNAGIGGGIHLKDSLSNIISGEVYSNTANTGAGIYFDSSPTNTLSADVYHNKVHSGGYGGGLYLKQSVIFFVDHTNRGNTGYGIYTNNSVFDNFNVIIWGTEMDTNSPANVGP